MIKKIIPKEKIKIMETEKTVVENNKKAIEENGVNYCGYKFTLNENDIKSLNDGYCIILNIDNEYTVLLDKNN